jgi:hypothetical protein
VVELKDKAKRKEREAKITSGFLKHFIFYYYCDYVLIQSSQRSILKSKKRREKLVGVNLLVWFWLGFGLFLLYDMM